MLHIVLYQPEIPPNTGNIMRLCANTGAMLHLVEPLGFQLDDRSLRRAGLDYIDTSNWRRYRNWAGFRAAMPDMPLWACTTRGQVRHDAARYQPGDGLLFGPETRGLPDDLLGELGTERCLRVPMRTDSRSMNLSNCVAVVLYEAWRQLDFAPLA